MTAVPITLRADETLADAARAMRDSAVGAVMVVRDGELLGLVTDRDIVIRAVAEERTAAACLLRDFCTTVPVIAGPDDDVTDVITTMRNRGVRRVPVVEGGRPTGLVSVGDIAAASDSMPVLADISTARPNS
jgi:CBS domain-containing protein